MGHTGMTNPLDNETPAEAPQGAAAMRIRRIEALSDKKSALGRKHVNHSSDSTPQQDFGERCDTVRFRTPVFEAISDWIESGLTTEKLCECYSFDSDMDTQLYIANSIDTTKREINRILRNFRRASRTRGLGR